MRNDEKIDIQLTDGSEEDLTAEELAQQHYNTALRYINIAEHMKQFEDQDKYYHRAIKYLRLARPYMEVRPLLRDLRKRNILHGQREKLPSTKKPVRFVTKRQLPMTIILPRQFSTESIAMS